MTAIIDSFYLTYPVDYIGLKSRQTRDWFSGFQLPTVRPTTHGSYGIDLTW